jgi:hypothetical protein
MRGLAEFTMRGRPQVLLVIGIAVFSMLFFWVGAAALALVTLRRGASEGAVILLWSLLPAVVVFLQFQEFAPLAALLGAYASAAVLRTTVSWPLTLLCATVSGLLTGIVLLSLAAGYLADIEAIMAQFIAQLQSQLATEGETLQLPVPDAVFIAGSFALVNALTVVGSVVLGRYWQALLYNPGGFRSEFHRIKLPPVMALALLFVALACAFLGGSWLPWGFLAVVPCLVAGIALVHGVVGLKRWKGYWLGVFYVLILLVNPFKELVIVAAVVDSVVDFRKRLAGGK